MADAKGAVSSKVTEVIDVTKETLQSSMEAARSAVTGSVGMVMDSKVGQTAVSRVEAMLGRTEDNSLPIGNEELGKETVYVAICNGNHYSGMGLMGSAMLEATWLLVQDLLILFTLCGKHLWSATYRYCLLPQPNWQHLRRVQT